MILSQFYPLPILKAYFPKIYLNINLLPPTQASKLTSPPKTPYAFLAPPQSISFRRPNNKYQVDLYKLQSSFLNNILVCPITYPSEILSISCSINTVMLLLQSKRPGFITIQNNLQSSEKISWNKHFLCWLFSADFTFIKDLLLYCQFFVIFIHIFSCVCIYFYINFVAGLLDNLYVIQAFIFSPNKYMIFHTVFWK